MKVLVTGASGLIGSHLCARLLADGHDVACMLNRNRNLALSLLWAQYWSHYCDIRSYEQVCCALRRVEPDVVVHLAACLPHYESDYYAGINSTGTNHLLKASVDTGVSHFVYASSMSVYSSPAHRLPVRETDPTQPATEYGITKLEGERLCNWYSSWLPTTILRFSSVYGVGDTTRVAFRFVTDALAGKPLLYDGDGEQSSDFTYVDDAVRGIMLSFEKRPNGAYNIGSGVETTIYKLALQILAITASSSLVVASGRKADRPTRFVADISKARVALGYSPISLGEGLDRYMRSLQDGQG